MKRILCMITVIITVGITVGISIGTLYADVRDVVVPKVKDKMERVTLSQNELGGELDRRINLLVYKNYMVVNLDRDWLDKFKNRTHRGNTAFVYYGIGKVIDAGSLFAQYTGDPDVAKRTQYLIDELRSSRDPDGYLGFWEVEPNNLQNYINWILHEQEYINLGLVRNYRTTGNPQSLEDARIMGDYILKTFPTDENRYYDPSAICTAGLPEGFLELYRVTGEQKYLDFAANVRHGNGSGEVRCASLKTWNQNFKTRPCHVYVMLARTFAQTELYRLDGSDSLMTMSRFMENELFEQGRGAFLISGSTSQGEHMTYNQNGHGSIQESCVTAYLLRWFDSLLRLEGDMKYGDLMERTIFNALFAAMAPDGRRICYFTPFTGQRNFQSIDTFCCNGNYRRAVAEIPQKVYYRFDHASTQSTSTQSKGIALNLYTNSEKTFDVAGQSVTIKQETNYPNDGTVKLTFTVSSPVKFAFRYRIPRWAQAVTCTVNGTSADEKVLQDSGCGELVRQWQTGDTVTLSLPVDWRLVRGRAVQDGRVALMRGPVLFGYSTRLNPTLAEKYHLGRDLVIDPTSIGQPELDDYVRPDGQKVTVKAWTNSDCTGEQIDVVLGEYVDDRCVSVYFKAPILSNTATDGTASDGTSPIRIMDDELISLPRKTLNTEIVDAWYGDASICNQTVSEIKQGTCLGDLAADYVPPAGKLNVLAAFPAQTGAGKAAGMWTLFNDGKQLTSSGKAYACPVGYAYGKPVESDEGLGFFSNYEPCENMDPGWLVNYTRDLFDKAIPADQRTNYLYTHPTSRASENVCARWTSDQPIPANRLAVAGTILTRSTDGVELRVQFWSENNELVDEMVFYSYEGTPQGPAAALDFAAPSGSGKLIKRVDLLINCNQAHSFDSTAINAGIYLSDTPLMQTNVLSKIKPLLDGKFEVNIGPFDTLFDDPAPGKVKVLKIKVRNTDTGIVSEKMYTDGQKIEL